MNIIQKCGVALLLGCMSLSASAAAIVNKTFCVYDPIGASGPAYQQLKDYQVAALAWGVKFVMKPYTDEKVAAEDFKGGVCDIVALTGARARQFNPFTGTLDAAGALPTYAHVKKALQALSGPKAANLMVNGDYEVAMLAPGGAAYLYLRDRSLNSIKSLAGKRFSVLESDPSQKYLVLKIGASPVSTSIAGMFSQFNNGSVDITLGPAVVYQAMELYKGLSPKGGVLNFPVGLLTLQVIIRRSEFPKDFAAQSRTYGFSRFDPILQAIKTSEKTIEKHWWINIPEADQREYREMFRQARIGLRSKGVYDAKMLTLMRKVRCSLEPANSECTAPDKE